MLKSLRQKLREIWFATAPNPELVEVPSSDFDDIELRAVQYLLDAKRYVEEHPVPEERKTSNNQYSHASDPPITPTDNSKPAITNCSYEHFKKLRISMGFPMFIKQTSLQEVAETGIDKFSAMGLGAAMNDILGRYKLAPSDRGDGKSGYYLPTNHWYYEVIIEDEKFEAAQEAIRLFVTLNPASIEAKDPKAFLEVMDNRMRDLGYSPILKHRNGLQLPPHMTGREW